MNICFVSDFFYPNVGGVEAHMYNLSKQLIKRGHKVVIITHSYGKRKGIKYLTSQVKVYYLPHWLVTDQVSLPTIFSTLPLFRSIIIRENIDIIHGHAAFSSMCHEAILHAKTMGIKAIFTDHSLFGFEDTSSILTNKLLKFTLSDVDHVICVSHTSKENTVLRASLNPRDVSVIPNAIVSAEYQPDPNLKNDKINIIVNCRLVYRKGIDLLVLVIPRICQAYPNVNFIISGDGPKRLELEQMREHFILQDRVFLLGRTEQSKGHIFLNTSLTEAFCIAIVEAASCGLIVVSTKVGGIPEVLPDEMILMGAPDPDSIISALEKAMKKVENNEIDRHDFHGQVKEMYSWQNVAERTEMVYERVLEMDNLPLHERLLRYNGCGVFAGKLSVMIMVVNYMFLKVLEWLIPIDTIDAAPRFDSELFKEHSNK
ncbi:hypothetical protein HDV01_002355 [Terramyces sp. JEL0728]|nr:hypothetical protein HDV01_002355 [Terramyces sp. JEL0728]